MVAPGKSAEQAPPGVNSQKTNLTFRRSRASEASISVSRIFRPLLSLCQAAKMEN